MRVLKRHANSLTVCVSELIIGILLLINPVGFTSGIIKAAGIVMLIWGLVSIIGYFRMDIEDAVISQKLMKGLVLMLAGVFCILKTHWFVTTFTLLTIVYGVAILLTGLNKVQWMVDMIRKKQEKWGFVAVSAAISLISAGIILSHPFASITVLWMFTGASLVVEAVFDILVMVISNRKKTTYRKSRAGGKEIYDGTAREVSTEYAVTEENAVKEEEIVEPDNAKAVEKVESSVAEEENV